jgi:hypothetical protein
MARAQLADLIGLGSSCPWVGQELLEAERDLLVPIDAEDDDRDRITRFHDL